MAITFADIQAACGLIQGALVLTPCLPSRTLSEITGARVALNPTSTVAPFILADFGHERVAACV